MVSLPFRAAQILLMGVDPQALLVWQSFLLFTIMFHHSNIQLPERAENAVVRFVVTPRMDGIHRSTELEHQDSNCAGGLTLWDRMHGTLKLDIRQNEIDIRREGFTTPEQVTLPQVIVLPFREELFAGTAATSGVPEQNRC